MAANELKKTLGPFLLWGLGVGYVISGMYFGWNLGLAEGGTYGMGIATIFVIVMYVTFVFSYTELACAIPKAGGAFDYVREAMGKRWGFFGGMAQNIEFIFAPPAISAAIGAYFSLFFEGVDPVYLAVLVYLVFTGINIIGVKLAASFELIITILAVAELLLFAGVAFTEFSWVDFKADGWNEEKGFAGIFSAIPFAIWFFLAIEGVANVAEEAKNPQRDILWGFGSAIATLVFLCIIVYFSSIGVAGWKNIVYAEGSTIPSDSPLPLALEKIVGGSHILYHLLIMVGLFGLVASFHGIILAAGRATYEFGKAGHFPAALGVVNGKTKTPANALVFNMFLGLIALLTGKTGDIIIIACFGALALYFMSMIALLKLRKDRPEMERPFKTPFYPYFPVIALCLAGISFISLSVYFYVHLLVFGAILLTSYGWYLIKDKIHL